MTATRQVNHTLHSEQAQLAGIIERLVARFPEIGRDELEDLVRGKYTDFDRAPIRDFVPILVERQADLSLNPSPRHRA
ncbi:MAG: hypothetical protein J0H43_03315 [Actinobacteria bacterium]|nr:hypothetical protein [Actinomycetota bacterium]